MEIQEQKLGAVTVIRPKGALCQQDAAPLRQRAGRLLEETLGRFVVDLAEVPFIDSEGLETLVELSSLLSESGQVLKVCGQNETLREVFDLTDVSSFLEHYEDVNSAIRSFL